MGASRKQSHARHDAAPPRVLTSPTPERVPNWTMGRSQPVGTHANDLARRGRAAMCDCRGQPRP
eukprot:5254043-Alexandrium_andersonii.AAC.1